MAHHILDITIRVIPSHGQSRPLVKTGTLPIPTRSVVKRLLPFLHGLTRPTTTRKHGAPCVLDLSLSDPRNASVMNLVFPTSPIHFTLHMRLLGQSVVCGLKLTLMTYLASFRVALLAQEGVISSGDCTHHGMLETTLRGVLASMMLSTVPPPLMTCV